ncbi:unnamed protein product [Moneuplotes crassus]|uniref:RING-type domain-containing protein n=1 Tax=Euplotes crassus TaxID=5936 RepID=A0AAD1U0H5_EUPCR|nr:unnamed protein product [Moneuplotes crassus]
MSVFEKVSKNRISKHYQRCNMMRKKYGRLFGITDQLLTIEANDLQDWRSLEALLNFLQGLVHKMIKSEESKPSKFREALKEKHQNNEQLNYMKNQSGIKEIKYRPGSVHGFEEEKYHKCTICSKPITSSDEERHNSILFSCEHLFHKNCTKFFAKKQYLKNTKIFCPECKIEIPNKTLNGLLGEDFIGNLETEQLKEYLMGQEDFVNCKCGNMLQLSPGIVDYNYKDDSGQLLSREAAQNMAKYRVRCNECNDIFCANCRTYPYHLGKTCKAFAEYQGAEKCRFCLTKLKTVRKQAPIAFKAVCRNSECEENMRKSCSKIHDCGHYCCGTKNEDRCLPCIDPECVQKSLEPTLGITGDDFCSICYMSGLSQAPSVQLGCKHIFHEECLIKVLEMKWSGPRINFEYIKCPTCKTEITCNHPHIGKSLKAAISLRAKINMKAWKRAKYEGINRDARLQASPYNGDLLSYAMARLSYYMCYKCHNPYFGGLKSCENNDGRGLDYFKPEELVCGSCSSKSIREGVKTCKKHGAEYIEFKCKFCCSVAQWFCWGSTHFCDECHTKQIKGENLTKKNLNELPQCIGESSCPLGIKHPPNGTQEYALGCTMCKTLTEHFEGF